MRPRPSPQTPRWQGRAAAIDRRPRRRRFCASWLSPSKPFLTASQLRQAHIIALTGHPVRPSTTGSSQKKKASLGRGGFPAQRRHFTTRPVVAAQRAQMQSITKMQIQTMDQMMDAWEEQIKSPNPMTGSPSAMLSKLTSLPGVSPAGSWPNAKRVDRDEPHAVLDAIRGAVAEGMCRRYVVLGQGRQAI